MTSRLISILAAVLCLQACAVHEPFRPRFEARRLVESYLGCADVQVAEAPHNPFAADPIESYKVSLIAWGCGQTARLRCDAFSVRDGHCEADPSYESPAHEAPQGTIRVQTRYANSEGITQRERIRVGNHGWIVHSRDVSERAFSFSVESGPTQFQIGSDPVFSQVNYHQWTTTHRERIGRYNYDVTRLHTRRTVHHYSEPGCARQFSLDVEEGQGYRVAFIYRGRGQCEVICAREMVTEHGIGATMGCPGFELL